MGEKVIVKLFPLLLLFLAVLYLSLVNSFWKPAWDSAYHLTVARSIVEGKGYTYLGYPCLKTTPGFPLLMAFMLWIFGLNFKVFNIFMIILAFCTVSSIYFLIRQYFSKAYTSLITIFTGISFLFLPYAVWIRPEIPYMMLSMLTLLYLDKFIENDDSWKYAILTGLLILLSYFFKTVGIALLISVVLGIFIKKKEVFKKLQIGILLLIVTIPVIIWNYTQITADINENEPVWQLTEFVPGSQVLFRQEWDVPGSKISGPEDIAVRMVKNAAFYAGRVASIILGSRINTSMGNLKKFPFWYLAYIFLIAFITLIGFLSNIISRLKIFDLYILIYFVILLVWSYREFRYLLPVIPFLIHYFIAGLISINSHLLSLIKIKYLEMSTLRILLIVFFTNFLISTGYSDYKIVRQQRASQYYLQSDQNFLNAIQWIKENTNEQGKIVSVWAPWVVLLAERWAVTFPWVEDEEYLMNFLKSVGAQYLVLAPRLNNDQRFFLPVVHSHPGFFQKKFISDQAIVYEIEWFEMPIK